MAETTATLLSPRRLVFGYLILALVGVVLMMTAGNPNNTFEQKPAVGSSPPTIAPVGN